jgi:hypothetical protein
MENPENLSAEELDARKEEMKTFYDQSVPYLQSQLKYEILLTEVEEARFKRANLAYQWQMIMANTKPPEEDDSGSDSDIDKKDPPSTQDKKSNKRKLKKS